MWSEQVECIKMVISQSSISENALKQKGVKTQKEQISIKKTKIQRKSSIRKKQTRVERNAISSRSILKTKKSYSQKEIQPVNQIPSAKKEDIDMNDSLIVQDKNTSIEMNGLGTNIIRVNSSKANLGQVNLPFKSSILNTLNNLGEIGEFSRNNRSNTAKNETLILKKKSIRYVQTMKNFQTSESLNQNALYVKTLRKRKKGFFNYKKNKTSGNQTSSRALNYIQIPDKKTIVKTKKSLSPGLERPKQKKVKFKILPEICTSNENEDKKVKEKKKNSTSSCMMTMKPMRLT